MRSCNRRVWLVALVSVSACVGDSSLPSAPSHDGNRSAILPSTIPLIPGALELWPGGPQMRNTASSRALKDRLRLQPLRIASSGTTSASGLAFAMASRVNLEVLGEGMTQPDGIFVTDISPRGVAVGRLATRAVTWPSGAVSPTFLPSRPEWGEHLSRAFRINTQGDIVGMVVSTVYEPGVTDVDRVRIVRWGVDGSIMDLPSPVADSFRYAAPFITDAGDIYATISPSSAGPYQIVRWHAGVPEIIAPQQNLPDASVIGVSRSGYLLAGNPFQLFEVRGPDGSWTTLQQPASSSGIGVRAPTEDGGALGVAVNTDGTQHGARWSPDGSVTVDPLPNGLTRFTYLAQNAGVRLAGEGCTTSGCSFYILDRGDATALPVPEFPGGQGSFQYANFGGLSDTDVAVGWYIDASLQIFSGVRWTLDFDNFPPAADAGTSYTGTEGTPIQFTGTADDATPTGTLTASWSFSDGATGTGLTPVHAFADNGSFVADLQVSDGELTAHAVASVVVSNVAPQVRTRPGNAFVAGTTHVLQADFADPGALDAPWIYAVNWGDGTRNTTGSTAAAGALNVSHIYKQAGIFPIRITVTDKDGGVGTGEYVVTVTKKGGR
jgi:PKD domain-containing protein